MRKIGENLVFFDEKSAGVLQEEVCRCQGFCCGTFLSLFFSLRKEEKEKEEKREIIRRKRRGAKNRRTTKSVAEPGFLCKKCDDFYRKSL